jgi:6-phosphogluconolactonase (cycloisomerase 2 family)
MNNDASAPAVIAFRRAADGSLTPLGAFPTGGRGTGGTIDPLMSQYSVLLDDRDRLLFVVNAGSDEVSAFRVRHNGTLELTDRVPSGGDAPVSLAIWRSRLYVLNTGDNTLSGFRVDRRGKLTPIANSTTSLAPGAAGASTIHFTTGGHWLIVTEIVSNRIETFEVQEDGTLGAPVVTPSSGAMPFGFDVTPDNKPIVTEATGAAPNGAVSSYSLGADGSLGAVTPSLDSGGMATCWLILTADGRYALVSNTLSNAIAAFRVRESGALVLLDSSAGETGEGSAPIDLDLASGDRYLYVLEGGSGNIATFDVGSGGTLSARADAPAGAPASGLQGLAAW